MGAGRKPPRHAVVRAGNSGVFYRWIWGIQIRNSKIEFKCSGTQLERHYSNFRLRFFGAFVFKVWAKFDHCCNLEVEQKVRCSGTVQFLVMFERFVYLCRLFWEPICFKSIYLWIWIPNQYTYNKYCSMYLHLKH